MLANLMQNLEKFLVLGNIRHRVPVIGIAGHAVFVDDNLGWHASQLEEFDLLPVAFQYRVFRVWQPDKRKIIFREILGAGYFVLRAYHDDFGVQPGEIFGILAQLRHMRTAERSGKTTIKNQHYIFLAAKIGKFHNLSPVIDQFKFGGKFTQSHFTHQKSPILIVTSALPRSLASAALPG